MNKQKRLKEKKRAKIKIKRRKEICLLTFGQLGSGSKVGSQPLTAQAKDAAVFTAGTGGKTIKQTKTWEEIGHVQHWTVLPFSVRH